MSYGGPDEAERLRAMQEAGEPDTYFQDLVRPYLPDPSTMRPIGPPASDAMILEAFEVIGDAFDPEGEE